MQNFNIGDRVVDKTTGKHGKVDSFIRPLGFRYINKTLVRLKLDDGGIADVELHNLAVEEGFKQPKVDNIGVNALENPNDITEALTPKKNKSKSKKKLDEIVDAVE